MRIKKIKWQQWTLTGILTASFFLNFCALAKEGYSNSYYAAAVKSMLSNPAAFFFASLDSGLYVTVDKPPLGLWLQAVSAKIFGVNAFGLILPSALSGLLCVFLVYRMVKRRWGATAGVIASGIIALTPILVALSRTNNLDVILLFFLLLGASFMLKAAEEQKLRYYLLAMLFVGLGFNTKMLQAFLVVPAFLLIYFLGKSKFLRKLWHSAVAICVLLAVSLSWALIVDSIPASGRPYIGGSSTNSVMELALGYNGLTRLSGQQMGTPGSFQSSQMPQNGGGPQQLNNGVGMEPEMQNSGRLNRNGPGGESESGERGALRLFSAQLSGLVSWFLLPAAGMAVLAVFSLAYWIYRRRRTGFPTEEQRQKLIHIVFWSAWLVPMAVFFSIGGFIHRYYVAMLCPSIAALAAIAAVLLWKSRQRRWLLPLCFLAVLAIQYIIVVWTAWTWLLLPMLVCGAAAIILIQWKHKVLQTMAAVLMAVALFIAPAAWSLTPVLNKVNANIPDAGPAAEYGGFGFGMNSFGDSSNSDLDNFLLTNYKGERWAIAVSNANEAESIILDTGLPVMAVGGFSGSDPILSLEQLQKYVVAGELKYYMLSSRGGWSRSSDIAEWVQANGVAINTGDGTIYDLSNTQ